LGRRMPNAFLRRSRRPCGRGAREVGNGGHRLAMVRRGGIRTLKEASSGTFHRALRRPYAKVLRLPIPPRARGTKYRPTRASNNRAPPQPSPPMALPQIRQGRRTDATTGTNWRRARWGHSRPPTPPNPRARSVTQGVVENGYALVSFAPSPFPTTAISDAQACFRETVAPNFKPQIMPRGNGGAFEKISSSPCGVLACPCRHAGCVARCASGLLA
jgi:hypothetical protein